MAFCMFEGGLRESLEGFWGLHPQYPEYSTGKAGVFDELWRSSSLKFWLHDPYKNQSLRISDPEELCGVPQSARDIGYVVNR